VKSVGLVFGHGASADSAQGPFLTDLAVHFAKHGHIVMRNICKQKEQRRQRIFERTADTAAMSPYGREVTKWIYLGHENGARIASLVGYKSPRIKHAFVLLSYPLLEPAPPPTKQKAGAEPPADSIGPLLRMVETCKAPVLFINGEYDYNCPGARLKALAPQIEATGTDARSIIFPELDAQFRAPGATEADAGAVEAIKSHVEALIKVVEEGNTSGWTAPKLEDIVPSNRIPDRPQPDLPLEDNDQEEGDGSPIGEDTSMQPPGK